VATRRARGVAPSARAVAAVRPAEWLKMGNSIPYIFTELIEDCGELLAQIRLIILAANRHQHGKAIEPIREMFVLWSPIVRMCR
jgi:hypothetical protein